uniref:Mediator of RNA polymerase II transcription subunit 10 n=1 Tax=Junco hyemalis TaxID=40217 RepID=A0A8C5JA56_JUNHY
MAEKFDSLEEHLEKFVENIRQLGIIVSDFQPSSQTGLNQKLNFMVTGLQDIDKCRQQLHDISVPLEVFEYIDQGRNPQLYTKECLERALAKNEQVKGKIDTMKGTLPEGEFLHLTSLVWFHSWEEYICMYRPLFKLVLLEGFMRIYSFSPCILIPTDKTEESPATLEFLQLIREVEARHVL